MPSTSIISAAIHKPGYLYRKSALYVVHRVHKIKNKTKYDQVEQIINNSLSKEGALVNPF